MIKKIKVFDSCGEFVYKINPQVDDSVTWCDVIDVATDVNNTTYILCTIVWLCELGTYGRDVQVFTRSEICNKFPVSGRWIKRLTVGHDRVFVNSWHVINVCELTKDQKTKIVAQLCMAKYIETNYY